MNEQIAQPPLGDKALVSSLFRVGKGKVQDPKADNPVALPAAG